MMTPEQKAELDKRTTKVLQAPREQTDRIKNRLREAAKAEAEDLRKSKAFIQ